MKKKTIKAWAIIDRETGLLQKYFNDGNWMIDCEQVDQKHLHKTFKSVPCTITY